MASLNGKDRCRHATVGGEENLNFVLSCRLLLFLSTRGLDFVRRRSEHCLLNRSADSSLQTLLAPRAHHVVVGHLRRQAAVYIWNASCEYRFVFNSCIFARRRVGGWESFPMCFALSEITRARLNLRSSLSQSLVLDFDFSLCSCADLSTKPSSSFFAS
jgi:hypothetical protein